MESAPFEHVSNVVYSCLYCQLIHLLITGKAYNWT